MLGFNKKLLLVMTDKNGKQLLSRHHCDSKKELREYLKYVGLKHVKADNGQEYWLSDRQDKYTINDPIFLKTLEKHRLIKCVQINGKSVYSVELKGTIKRIQRYAKYHEFIFCPTNDTEFRGHWHTNKPSATYIIDDHGYKKNIFEKLGIL